MTLIHMIMTHSLGMTTPMRTNMELDVLEKWRPTGMASVVLGLLMVPKWEVRSQIITLCYYRLFLLLGWWLVRVTKKVKENFGCLIHLFQLLLELDCAPLLRRRGQSQQENVPICCCSCGEELFVSSSFHRHNYRVGN